MKDYPRQSEAPRYTKIESGEELLKYIDRVDLVEQIAKLKAQLAALHKAIKPLRGRIGDLLRNVIENNKENEMNHDPNKFCNNCRRIKPATSFRTSPGMSKRRPPVCADCYNLIAEARAKAKEGV